MGRVIRIIKRYIASEVWPVHVRSVRDMFVYVRLVHVAIAVDYTYVVCAFQLSPKVDSGLWKWTLRLQFAY